MKQSNDDNTKGMFYVLFLLVVTLVLSGCGTQNAAVDNTPASVVQEYFTSWTAKEYATMYTLVSDGFKKVELTAASLESFKKELGKFFDQGDGITVIKAVTTQNDGRIAKVNYTIEMSLKTRKQQFSGTYTLRNTATGWKLIHPYGNNVDLSEEK